MYRDKVYRERELPDVLEDLRTAVAIAGHRIDKVFVGDGDALGMPTESVAADPRRGARRLPEPAPRVVLRDREQPAQEDARGAGALRERGPDAAVHRAESGDDATLKRIAKGATHAEHVEAAHRAHTAGMEISMIVLLGVAARRARRSTRRRRPI
jgi:hypothetical protein